MARDCMELGPVPADESCEQVRSNGTTDYTRMRAECTAYKHQLERQFPDAPEGTYFRVKSYSHDFGTYYEVCVNYDMDDDESSEYAFKVENDLPGNWDDKALSELGQAYPDYLDLLAQRLHG